MRLWKPSNGMHDEIGHKSYLVSGGQDNTVNVTDLDLILSSSVKVGPTRSPPCAGWEAEHKWSCHSIDVFSAENVCVTGSNSDKYIRVWSLMDGSLIKKVGPMGSEMRAGRFSVMCLAFAGDGTIGVGNSNDCDSDVLSLVTRR